MKYILPKSIHRLSIERVLKNPTRNYGVLVNCFSWMSSPQGSDYWFSRSHHPGLLSNVDFDYLQWVLDNDGNSNI